MCPMFHFGKKIDVDFVITKSENEISNDWELNKRSPRFTTETSNGKRKKKLKTQTRSSIIKELQNIYPLEFLRFLRKEKLLFCK